MALSSEKDFVSLWNLKLVGMYYLLGTPETYKGAIRTLDVSINQIGDAIRLSGFSGVHMNTLAFSVWVKVRNANSELCISSIYKAARAARTEYGRFAKSIEYITKKGRAHIEMRNGQKYLVVHKMNMVNHSKVTIGFADKNKITINDVRQFLSDVYFAVTLLTGTCSLTKEEILRKQGISSSPKNMKGGKPLSEGSLSESSDLIEKTSGSADSSVISQEVMDDFIAEIRGEKFRLMAGTSKGQTTASYRTLASMFGVHPNTIMNWVNSFVKKGIVRKHENYAVLNEDELKKMKLNRNRLCNDKKYAKVTRDLLKAGLFSYREKYLYKACNTLEVVKFDGLKLTKNFKGPRLGLGSYDELHYCPETPFEQHCLELTTQRKYADIDKAKKKVMKSAHEYADYLGRKVFLSITGVALSAVCDFV